MKRSAYGHMLETASISFAEMLGANDFHNSASFMHKVHSFLCGLELKSKSHAPISDAHIFL